MAMPVPTRAVDGGRGALGGIPDPNLLKQDSVVEVQAKRASKPPLSCANTANEQQHLT
ncbi:MAG TPA: hypothetical protein VFJ19_02630 [Nocardioidaceae bacterium]|nr:hypothetical protein [Nocardioidaceae bacterium]